MMANKQSQETPGGYMDGVKVKISEKYKPPPRISLAMSYAQRLSLNKQIQDSIPQCEFLLEKTVKQKLEEWRTARTVMCDQLKTRLVKVRSEEKKKLEELLEAQKRLKEEETEEDIANTVLDTVSSSVYLNTSKPSHNTYPEVFHSNHSILIPVQTNSCSNILMPIPLKSYNSNENPSFKAADKSPFNISDFEADTSSPFDNMELKSINDMEELAQVLKRDDTIINKSAIMNNYTPLSSGYTNFTGTTTYDYTSAIPNSTSYVQPTSSSMYHNTNGYYYPMDAMQSVNSTPYSYGNQIDCSSYSNRTSDPENPRIPTFNSVPDILKTLRTELDNTHIDNTKIVTNNSVNIEQPLRPKSTDAVVYPRAKTKSEDLDETFTSLPKSMQDMSKSISSMGFPLSRVARVCKTVGNDQKKIVEHLLAMTELLELGFSESVVSKALLQCNNDRDRALNLLIS